MRAFFSSLVHQLKDFWSGLTKRERNRFAVLTALIVLLGTGAAYLLGRTEYGVLYQNLEAKEAGEVLAALEEMGVSVRTEGAGTILAPREQVGELRMRLSAEGYLSQNYLPDIYSAGSSGMGRTAQEQLVYYTYQKQADIRRAILQMDKVEECVVLINMAKESSYVWDPNAQPTSASVLLEIRRGELLENGEANAIAALVSTALPGLSYENIHLVDSKMNQYHLGAPSAEGGGAQEIGKQFELENMVRDRLQKQVLNLLSPVFGTDRVNASVNVRLNFDRERIQSVEFSPPEGMDSEGLVISMSELYENARDGSTAGGIPGTDANGMGAAQYPYGDLGEDEYYSKVLREMNYEINETTTEVERAQGVIKSLSIAVLVDSEAVGEDHTADVTTLVAQALGVNENYVSVRRLPFQSDPNPYAELLAEQRASERQIRMWEMAQVLIKAAVIVVLALLLFLMVRSVLKAREDRERVILMPGGAQEGEVPVGIDYLAGEGEDGPEEENFYADVKLSAKSAGIEQLERIIDKNPQAVAMLLRNWLSEEAK
ncbi:MAG: flagellar M-ring protein FliF [Clostridiales bacterium]|nr:flagellar M-ring protein FliF [Clostridiales bacterium]